MNYSNIYLIQSLLNDKIKFNNNKNNNFNSKLFTNVYKTNLKNFLNNILIKKKKLFNTIKLNKNFYLKNNNNNQLFETNAKFMERSIKERQINSLLKNAWLG